MIEYVQCELPKKSSDAHIRKTQSHVSRLSIENIRLNLELYHVISSIPLPYVECKSKTLQNFPPDECIFMSESSEHSGC